MVSSSEFEVPNTSARVSRRMVDVHAMMAQLVSTEANEIASRM